jgi:hypothetical protein
MMDHRLRYRRYCSNKKQVHEIHRAEKKAMRLNRRNFIGGMVAAAASPRLPASQTAPSQFSSSSQGKWMNKGLVDAGGFHEPYIFVVRRGGQRLDARQTSDYQQSEALIRELRDQGVEVFHTHLYKGFGMEAEQEEMEQTRKTVAFVHSLGMKADTYIQWNSMMYETFFAEEPEAIHWIQRNVAGLPILLPYGYQQSFRYRPCFANQNYLNYLKKVVRYAVVDVKADFIHFDNFDLNAEPDSCHCLACVSGFRERLKTKYTVAQLKERFGFSRVDFINPPQWNEDNPPARMQIVSDPAFQEWIDFRCQLMSDALKQMYDLVHSLNPEVALEINPGGITGQNHPWMSGTDHARLLKFTRSFWSEEGNDPAMLQDGRLISRIRSYKLARAYSNVLITYVENNPLALGEALAFNQTIGYLGAGPLSGVTRTYLDFYLKHRESYEDAEDAGNVAVFRSYASLAYNNAEVQLCTILVEQTLIQTSVPFDLIFDNDLRKLDKYKVVILPNTECLSDDQVNLLKTFVTSGGSLVVIGQTGFYDEWRRVRVIPALHTIVDYRENIAGSLDSTNKPAGAETQSSKKQVGRGRVAYLSSVEFDGPLPPARPNFSILNEYWRLPKNWEDLSSLVRWAANENIPLSIKGPVGVVAHSTLQRSQRRTFVHLLNYNAAEVPIQHDIHVHGLLPEGSDHVKATIRRPEQDEETEVVISQEPSGMSSSISELRYYALLTIHW